MILNKRKRNWLIVFIVLVPVIAGSCYRDKEELLYPGSTQTVDCATVPATFKADVLPLITSQCAIPGCHDATASGGFIFQNYTQINTAKDLIYTQAVVQKTMPPTGPLLPADVNKLKCWIDGGALNN
jgi:hypothetical protein